MKVFSSIFGISVNSSLKFWQNFLTRASGQISVIQPSFVFNDFCLSLSLRFLLPFFSFLKWVFLCNFTSTPKLKVFHLVGLLIWHLPLQNCWGAISITSCPVRGVTRTGRAQSFSGILGGLKSSLGPLSHGCLESAGFWTSSLRLAYTTKQTLQ